MKIQPIAQGTGVPAQSDSSLGRTADPMKMARAKAIAAGQMPPPEAKPSGDHQADRTTQSLQRIKMRTNRSTNRHEFEEPAQELQAPTEQDSVLEAGVEVSTSGESPTIDTNEPAPETEEIKPLSPQFAALAKMKRALQIERQKLEQEKAELAQKGSVNPEEFVSKAELLANPLKIFETGLTYDQLTEAILQNQSGQSFDAKKLREEIKAELKSELTNELSARDQQAEKQILAEYDREAQNLIAQNPDDYEAIRAANGQKLVVDLIHRTWKKTGEVLDTKEAADLVENQLIEESLPYAKLKKVQSRLTPQQEAQLAAQNPAQPKTNTKVMRTLTNRDSAMPRSDRRSRAIAAFTGALKRG